MRERELLDAIEKYTQENGRMPTRIHGTFKQLLPMSEFANYTKFMGKDVYIVPLGHLELELDTRAINWYVS